MPLLYDHPSSFLPLSSSNSPLFPSKGDPCHDRAGELTDFSGWKTKGSHISTDTLAPTHIQQTINNQLTTPTTDASKLPKCEGVASCPLGVNHPPNGIEHPIGCSICRERVSFIYFSHLNFIHSSIYLFKFFNLNFLFFRAH